ncbi:hypothetical protein LQE92_04915 [Lacrimispora sp. NSJ-141]|uniref:shikimate dehydrogenase (NADP(+)) n=1 Tax=Lientehia hominis TaxID=2897778 RepID=A0AAP2W8A9_9FIRM|nr:hypothetical protein [Lientehia hominis]MCD2491965.1 hypothetical protein [Lientehia hominis]
MAHSNLICNVETRLMPIIGYPMDHSSASQVYNKLFEIYNINRVMFPIEIQPEGLADYVAAAKTLNIDTYSLTMPLKAAIIPYLDDVDPCSRVFNSVNIVKTVDGKTYGAGMDGKGCVGALLAAGASIEGKTIVLVGAGSISGAIIYELIQHKAGRIILMNRTLAHAESIAKTIEDNWSHPVEAYEATPELLDKYCSCADIFIHSSPVGMHGFPATHSYLGYIEKMPKSCFVLDAIVNPEYTELLKKAQSCGLTVIPGMHMMISQMTEIFDFCFGVRPGEKEKAECREVLIAYLDSVK